MLLLLLLCAGTTARYHHTVPEFWWDLTLDHSAPISRVVAVPQELTDSCEWNWSLDWATGVSKFWQSGSQGAWTAWSWNATSDPDVSGGGFLYSDRGSGGVAGVSWLLEARSGAITWNCFVEGSDSASLPWSEWNDTSQIGFVKLQGRWGFYTGSHTVVSKHCAAGPGKRYKYLKGREIETHVQRDPFQGSKRQKRSPQFFERVSQTLKEWMEKVKRFFSSDQQTVDGEGATNPEGREGGKCNTLIDLMVRLIDMIFGWTGRRSGSPGQDPGNVPTTPAPSGAPPQEESGAGGADVEELDPSQNDAVRDWE